MNKKLRQIATLENSDKILFFISEDKHHTEYYLGNSRKSVVRVTEQWVLQEHITGEIIWDNDDYNSIDSKWFHVVNLLIKMWERQYHARFPYIKEIWAFDLRSKEVILLILCNTLLGLLTFTAGVPGLVALSLGIANKVRANYYQKVIEHITYYPLPGIVQDNIDELNLIVARKNTIGNSLISLGIILFIAVGIGGAWMLRIL